MARYVRKLERRVKKPDYEQRGEAARRGQNDGHGLYKDSTPDRVADKGVGKPKNVGKRRYKRRNYVQKTTY